MELPVGRRILSTGSSFPCYSACSVVPFRSNHPDQKCAKNREDGGIVNEKRGEFSRGIRGLSVLTKKIRTVVLFVRPYQVLKTHPQIDFTEIWKEKDEN
ncbi:MAG: hypothetical protein D6679_05965 [Candidatus Hydrogenedentota bacterium]|nr:MAG: hypothetical protein D6679_05965 [Candidatus Hydrogenedentota bacterium]